jgi:hypothetical protein
VSLRGALPERLSPSWHRLSPALGSASPGVLRPYDACSSRCPVSAMTGSTGHGRRGIPPPRPVPPSRFSQRLGGLSRDDIRRARVAPNPPFAPSLRPGVSRPCCMPRRPWDSPFRAFPSRGAVPPLDGLVLPRGFEVDRDSGAKTPCVSDRFPPRAASWPCSEPPRRDSRARLGTRERGFPRPSVRPTITRASPRAV